MGRNYKRITNKATWTKESMAEACAQVASGRSVKSVAKAFEIPRTSLRNQLKKRTPQGPKMGKKPVFNDEQEEELKNHVLLLSKLYYGVTTTQIRQIAYEYAEKNNIKNNFNKQTKKAGEGWLSGFMRRCGDLTIRKPEHTSLSRIMGFNKVDVSKFYHNLEEVYNKYKFPASRVFNCDETGVNTVGSAVKILAKKGQKQVGLISSAERGTNTTVVCCFSAAGFYIPPMFIFKRQRMTPLLEKDGPPGALYTCSKSGWITEELFVKWLEHFQKTTKCSSAEPVLLVLDNHSSHVSLCAYNFCKANGIVMVSLPPHTSHRIQPLDVVFFGPLKKAINREIDLHLKHKQYERVGQYDIASIFKSAYGRVSSVDKAIKGFQCTGIFPLNPNVFDDMDFTPPAEDLSVVVESSQPVAIAGPSNLDVVAKSPYADPSNQDVSANPVSQSSCSAVSNQAVGDISSRQIPVSEITPIPRRGKKSQKQIRKKGSSKILTSTPFKDELIEKSLKREKKAKVIDKSKVIKIKKKVFSSSSSETSAEVEYDDEGLKDQDSSDEETCIICGECGKNETWFRCTICGKWAHKDCSGADNYKTYICDFCT